MKELMKKRPMVSPTKKESNDSRQEVTTTGMSLDEANKIIDNFKKVARHLDLDISYLYEVSATSILMIIYGRPSQLMKLADDVRYDFIEYSTGKLYQLKEHLDILLAHITIMQHKNSYSMPEWLHDVVNVAAKLRYLIEELFNKKTGYRYDMRVAREVADLIERYNNEIGRIMPIVRHEIFNIFNVK